VAGPVRWQEGRALYVVAIKFAVSLPPKQWLGFGAALSSSVVVGELSFCSAPVTDVAINPIQKSINQHNFGRYNGDVPYRSPLRNCSENKPEPDQMNG